MSAPTSVTTVLIVDDDSLARDALRTMLEDVPGLQVVGEAENGEEAVRRAASVRPDVVLMDVLMSGTDGIQATHRILSSGPSRPRVIVITTFENNEYVYEAIRAGASGFVLKRAASSELVPAIRTAVAGESMVLPARIRSLIEQFSSNRASDRDIEALIEKLTPREREVLRLMASGLDNESIGKKLYIAMSTVKTHVGNIFERLGVSDRTQAVIAAYEGGLKVPGSDADS